LRTWQEQEEGKIKTNFVVKLWRQQQAKALSRKYSGPQVDSEQEEKVKAEKAPGRNVKKWMKVLAGAF